MLDIKHLKKWGGRGWICARSLAPQLGSGRCHARARVRRRALMADWGLAASSVLSSVCGHASASAWLPIVRIAAHHCSGGRSLLLLRSGTSPAAGTLVARLTRPALKRLAGCVHE